MIAEGGPIAGPVASRPCKPIRLDERRFTPYFYGYTIFLGNDASVLHWRGDTFDLPAAASRLASNATYDNQAFSYGEHVLALQFHMEAEPRRLDQWYIGHAVELVAANVSVIDRLAPPD